MTLGHLGHLGYEILGTHETLGIYMRHLRHYKLQMLYICKNIFCIYFLVKYSISKVSTVHNVGSKLGHSLRRWPVIDALLDKYSAQKETLISFNLLKTFRLI